MVHSNSKWRSIILLASDLHFVHNKDLIYLYSKNTKYGKTLLLNQKLLRKDEQRIHSKGLWHNSCHSVVPLFMFLAFSTNHWTVEGGLYTKRLVLFIITTYPTAQRWWCIYSGQEHMWIRPMISSNSTLNGWLFMQDAGIRYHPSTLLKEIDV